MGTVMVIPAKRQVGNNIKKAEKPKLRVAAYCRVSTDSDEQATSYEAQIEHYTEYISKNPEWVLAGIFADDGITGTNTKKRDEFNRMIEECHAGNIDMIITKSISRFARNTLDCLKYIRELKDLNIPVFFEKESINTMDAKGEVLLTIMASLAQQESQSLSQNVKLGIQYRYQQGKVQINRNRFLGYTKDEPIIPKDIFLLVQEELVRRRVVHTSDNGKRHCYSCKHCFSQIVICGECGEFFRRVHWNNRGCKSIVWRCCSRLEATGHACHSRTVNETLLEQVVIDAINRVLCQKDDFLQTLRANIATVVLQGDALSPEVIDERLSKLQKELLKKVNQKDDYDAIADEILRLRDQRRQAEVDSVIKDEQMKQIRDLQDFAKSQPATITEFDETLVSRLIAKITVFDNHFTVDFKSGITIDIES